jgi:hypothetical protein
MQWRWASIAVEAILLEVYNLSILISQAILQFFQRQHMHLLQQIHSNIGTLT